MRWPDLLAPGHHYRVGKLRRTRWLWMFGSLGQIAKATDEQAHEAGVDVKTAAEIRKVLS